EFIASLGRRIENCLLLSKHGAGKEVFKLSLKNGDTFKIRLFLNKERIGSYSNYMKSVAVLNCFPKIVDYSDFIVVEEWIKGSSLAEISVTPETLHQMARLM